MSEFVSDGIFYTEGKEVTILKSNALVEGAYDLTPAEHDLMTLAINKLHTQGTGGKQVFITAKEFAIANKITDSHAYQVLKNTAKTLYERKLTCEIYIDEAKEIAGDADFYTIARPKGLNRPIKMNFRWLQAVSYQDNNGFIYLMFSDPLAYLISKTGEAYTKYDYEKTISLKGFHTKRLYELVCKWAGAKPIQGGQYPNIKMVVDEWKEFFGCAEKYSNIAEFKRRVLKPCIQEINENKEFELTLSEQKIGRIISHFSIEIKDKRQKDKPKHPFETRDPNTPDMFTGQTDKEAKATPSWHFKGLSDGQINKLKVFAKEFCDANIDKMPPNFKGNYNELIDHWVLMLKNPNHVHQFKKVQELLERQPQN